MLEYEKELAVALEAVALAGRLCESVRQRLAGGAGGEDSIQKEDRSPVTVADFGSQALVARRLAETFAGDTLVAEEAANALRAPEGTQHLERVLEHVRELRPGAGAGEVLAWIDRGGGIPGGRFWTLDPIDGTKGFLRQDQYAVALALIVDGTIQLGALACPALPLDASRPDGERGAVFYAQRGGGAWMRSLQGGDPVRVRVAARERTESLRFVESVESAHGDHARQETVARAVGIRAPSVRMDSQAKYAAVARGDAALYLRLPSPKSPDYREKIWDHAAGVIVIEEAGGRVTDVHGRALDFTRGRKLTENRGVVASSGFLHDAALKALREW